MSILSISNYGSHDEIRIFQHVIGGGENKELNWSDLNHKANRLCVTLCGVVEVELDVE